tara:strand:- start:1169 stop:1552 length:384 start_codon:yes stop_codon:yes gene_type:complete
MFYRKIKKIRTLFIIICILQLLHILHFRSGFQYQVIKNPFDVDAGIPFVLSSKVIEINQIIKNQNIKNFYLSETLKNNSYLHKKSVEFNYPILMDKKSRMIFYLKNEKVPESCIEIETRKHFKLAQC